MTMDSWLSAADGDAQWLLVPCRCWRDLAFPTARVWGRSRRAGRTRRAARATTPRASASPTRSSATRARTSSGPEAACCAWPADTGREPVQRVRDVERARRSLIGGELDFATPPQVATQRVASLPAERPPGRAARVRAHDDLLGRPAESGHAADQHLPRQRPRRHVALQAEHVDFTPEVSRRRSARASQARCSSSQSSSCSRCCGCRPRAPARRFGRKSSASCARLSDRARTGRLVPRRAGRHHDDARRRSRRRAARRPLGRRADRSRSSTSPG